jgi:hypothetical protein
MNAARRTLGCWIFAAFLERGCDSPGRRLPRRVQSVRPLSPREMADLNPLLHSLVPSSNLRRMPRSRRPRQAAALL